MCVPTTGPSPSIRATSCGSSDPVGRANSTNSARTIAFVANQESQAAEKQQRGSCRPRGAIRLAHLPGDAAVSPGAARLLSTWRCSSAGRRGVQVTAYLSWPRVSRPYWLWVLVVEGCVFA